MYIAELTSSGETVLSQHGAWCRVLAVCERVAANAVFVCMLVEGVYLHRLIVAVFRSNIKIKWLYGAGAGTLKDSGLLLPSFSYFNISL